MKTCIIIGAGGRGKDAYAPYIKDSGIMEIIGVAEPDDAKRNDFKTKYNIADDMCFNSYEDLFAKGKLADSVIICTQDRQHKEPAKMAMDCGYHILLEKPISPYEHEVRELERLALEYDKVFITAYVLRYTPFVEKLKELIKSGAIGDILTMQLNSNEGFWHHAHSFVRGQWNNSETSSPLIVAKSCHDLDLISYILESKCTSIASYGGNNHFTWDNAPGDDVPDRCTDGCPYADKCKYNAIQLYTRGKASYFVHKFETENSDEAIIEALKTNMYGRCVYRCDNNVCDQQVAAMTFENGATAVYTISAFSVENSRTLKIMGTEGEIGGYMEGGEIRLKRFDDMSEVRYKVLHDSTKHCGGDSGLIQEFAKLMEQEKIVNDTKVFQSMKMAFAAEKSRLSDSKVDVD